MLYTEASVIFLNISSLNKIYCSQVWGTKSTTRRYWEARIYLVDWLSISSYHKLEIKHNIRGFSSRWRSCQRGWEPCRSALRWFGFIYCVFVFSRNRDKFSTGRGSIWRCCREPAHPKQSVKHRESYWSTVPTFIYDLPDLEIIFWRRNPMVS